MENPTHKIELDFTINPHHSKHITKAINAHNLTFEVINEDGPGGGNPEVRLMGKEEDIKNYLTQVYCYNDIEEAQMFYEYIEPITL